MKTALLSFVLLSTISTALGRTCAGASDSFEAIHSLTSVLSGDQYFEGYRCFSHDGKTTISVHPQYYSTEEGLLMGEAKAYTQYWVNGKSQGSHWGSFNWETLVLDGVINASFNGEKYSPSADIETYNKIMNDEMTVLFPGLPTYKKKLLTKDQWARITYLHEDPDFVAGFAKQPKVEESLDIGKGVKAYSKLNATFTLPDGKKVQTLCYEIDNGPIG